MLNDRTRRRLDDTTDDRRDDDERWHTGHNSWLLQQCIMIGVLAIFSELQI